MGVVFVSGIYGVGKSTICNQLNNLLKIPHYSASSLITESSGECYGVTKYVTDVNVNQEILINAIDEKLKLANNIIVSGHFCIFDKKLNIVEIPTSVYQNLNLDGIILLESNVERIKKHLLERDFNNYPQNKLAFLQSKELELAEYIANSLKIHLYRHSMNYKNDLQTILGIVRKIWSMDVS